MKNIQLYSIKTISEFHLFRGLPKPEHPLISLINIENIRHLANNEPMSLMFDFIPSPLKEISVPK